MSRLHEDQMIDRWIRLAGRPPAGWVGIGDDCAVVPAGGNTKFVVTTDLLVEGVHFLKTARPEDVAFKSLAVNLSDCAAAGAKPRGVWLSVALPTEKSRAWFLRFQREFSKAARAHKVKILGGDTTGSPGPVFVNVTLLGERKGPPPGRRGAKVGDILAVTGTLGEAALGLAAVRGRLKGSQAGRFRTRFVRPEAEVALGQWLGGQPAVQAMMDLSDGLADDARRMARASGVTVTLESEKLLVAATTPAFRSACQKLRWDPLKTALCGGEDFRLLISVSPKAFERLRRAFQARWRRPLIAVGRVGGGADGQVFLESRGRRKALRWQGYEHFPRS